MPRKTLLRTIQIFPMNPPETTKEMFSQLENLTSRHYLMMSDKDATNYTGTQKNIDAFVEAAKEYPWIGNDVPAFSS